MNVISTPAEESKGIVVPFEPDAVDLAWYRQQLRTTKSQGRAIALGLKLADVCETLAHSNRVIEPLFSRQKRRFPPQAG